MRYSGGDPNLGNTGGLGHQVQEGPTSSYANGSL